MLDVLANRSHQIIYGRRGVGKTHALRYFQNMSNENGDVAVYVDSANLGSSNSVYNDTSLTVYERATRLLLDVCATMHTSLLDAFSDPQRGWSLSEIGPLLDGFTDALSEMRVEGSTVHETRSQQTHTETSGWRLGASISAKPEISTSAGSSDHSNRVVETKEKQEGNAIRIVNFQFLAQKTFELARHVAPRRIWLLVDEWSTVPRDLQPYLADLIRRSFFNIPSVSVKIAAIEQRSVFRSDRHEQGYVGIELGADATVALNLDDYLVYDANPTRSTQFFRSLIQNHVAAICREDRTPLSREALMFGQDMPSLKITFSSN